MSSSYVSNKVLVKPYHAQIQSKHTTKTSTACFTHMESSGGNLVQIEYDYLLKIVSG